MSGKTDHTCWRLILVLVVLAVVAFIPFAMMGGWGMGPGMMGWGMMGFGWPFMFIVPIAFVFLIVLGLYYLLSGRGSATSYAESNAIRILKERYARGEITSEQYSKMKRELES